MNVAYSAVCLSGTANLVTLIVVVFIITFVLSIAEEVGGWWLEVGVGGISGLEFTQNFWSYLSRFSCKCVCIFTHLSFRRPLAFLS